MIDDNEIYIFKDFMSHTDCDEYFKKIKDIGPQPKMLEFEHTTLDLTGDPIGKKVQNFINKEFNMNLKLDQLQIQNWHVNSYGVLHTHFLRPHIVYTGSLYLNDDFLGGEFITNDGRKFKPTKKIPIEEIKIIPAANPSNPSIQLIAFVVPTIQNTVIK